jgi:hypothetical protein
MGDSTSSRQPAEPSAFFGPKVFLPVRGDWLVELRGFEPETPQRNFEVEKLDGDREFVPNSRSECYCNVQRYLEGLVKRSIKMS